MLLCSLKKITTVIILALLTAPLVAVEEGMGKMWGDAVAKLRVQDTGRGELFAEGNLKAASCKAIRIVPVMNIAP
ncbi:MAG: hypothetical protein PHO37_02310 [Kiritimatiellae bacterium]|nr:hypothetical protein [Kiritimatiellia bacterium]